MNKIILLSIITVFVFSLPVMAQDKDDAKKFIEYIKKDDENLMKDLDLTEAQRKKLKLIDSKYSPILTAMRKKIMGEMTRQIDREKPDKEKRTLIIRRYIDKLRVAQNPIRDRQTKELNRIYTPEQLKKIRDYQIRRMELGRKIYSPPVGKK